MPEITIKPEELDYTTFALTLGRLSESERAEAVARVKELLRRSRPNAQRSTVSESDEEIAFRADIAAQVLRELVAAGKVKRLIHSDA